MEIRKGKLLLETAGSKMYATGDPKQIIIRYKDEIITTKKKGPVKVKNKGNHDAAITSALYSYVAGYHIPTHFIKLNKPAELLIHPTEPIPIEVVIWNFAEDRLSLRYGIKKGTPLKCAVVEYFLDNKKLKNPMIHFDHACALEIVTLDEMHRIDQYARKTNAVLKSFFERREFKLVYFSIEFGRFEDQLLMTSDLGLNTLHLWDISDAGSPREVLKEDASGLDSAYEKLKERICK